MAGYTYWFPKAFGFTLDERLGQGDLLVLVHRLPPRLHAALRARPVGRTRRMQHYRRSHLAAVAARGLLGAVIIVAGIVCQVVQLLSRSRPATSGATSPATHGTAGPWSGYPLAAAALQLRGASPTFMARKPTGRASRRAIKQDRLIDEPDYKPIEMPINTPTGVIIAFFASVCGFAVIWHIWWLAILGLIGAFVATLVFASRDEHEIEIPARARCPLDRAHRAEVADMNIAVAIDDVRHDALPSASEAGPAPKSIVVAYGFWMFVLSDIVLFSALFAAYAMLVRATDGGPTGARAVRPRTVAQSRPPACCRASPAAWMSLAVANGAVPTLSGRRA